MDKNVWAYAGMASQNFHVGVKLLMPSLVSGPSRTLRVTVRHSVLAFRMATASVCARSNNDLPLICRSTSPFWKYKIKMLSLVFV